MKRFFNQSALAAATAAAVLSGCNYGEQSVQVVADVQHQTPLDGSAKAGTPITDSYIVVLKPEAGIQGNLSAVTARVNALLADYGISQTAVAAVFETALQGFSVNVNADKAGLLTKDPRVKYVEQDRVVTLDPNEFVNAQESGARVQTQTTPWGITRVGGAGDGTGKLVWVMDTGVDVNHPDLTINTTFSKNFTGGGANNYADGNGHGTHVSGIIAAKNNNDYVVGVAAGASVVAVKVLNNQGTGSGANIANGINHVAKYASAGDVANMSLCFSGVATYIDDAVIALANKGVKIAISAGNTGVDASGISPGRANHANIYTVSAMNSSDVMAGFSNFNNPPVDYAAPGVSVLSLYKNSGTATMSGTSMAAPHVAGILLLGAVATDGYITVDKDSTPDPIAHR